MYIYSENSCAHNPVMEFQATWLVASGTEGGANVFCIEYFLRTAGFLWDCRQLSRH